MKYDNCSEISWKCNNWYERDDGLIEIMKFTGEKVLLNSKMKKIWVAIDYEATMSAVWETVSGDISESEFQDILKVMEENNLIYIRSMDDMFNQIFN